MPAASPRAPKSVVLMRAVAWREWQRLRSTPRLWLLAIIAPLILVAILLGIFAQPTPRDLPVVVVDLDRSSLSRQAQRMLQAAPALQVIAVMDDMAAAGSRVRRGEAYAVIALPPDLQRDVLRGQVPRVQLYYNSQMMTAGNVVLRDVRQALGTLGAGIGMEQGVAPPLTTQLHAAFNPGLDYARFLVLALALALLHIAAVVIAIDVVGRELRDGTAADWLAHADGRIVLALLGKLLPWALWLGIYGIGLMGACVWWLGVRPAGSVALWALTWQMLVLASFGLGVLLVALTANLRVATSAASILVSPAFAYSGMTFPLIAMPAFASFWSTLLPLHHGLTVQTQQLLMAAPVGESMSHLLILLLFALLPLPVARRLRRACIEPSFWGRT